MLIGLSRLETLDLSENELAEIEGRCFAGLDHLKSMLLNQKRLTEIGSEVFFGLFKLETLDLSENRVDKINERALRYLSSLRVLLLASNPLTRVIKKATFKYYFTTSIQLIDLSTESQLESSQRNSIVSFFNKSDKEKASSDEKIRGFFRKKVKNFTKLNEFLSQFPGSNCKFIIFIKL